MTDLITIKQIPLPGVLQLDLTVKHDDYERGTFTRLGDIKFFKEHNIPTEWTFENELSNMSNTLRGLHFQFPPHGEEKLVHVIDGNLYNIVVDLRKNSPTFGKSELIFLSSGYPRAMLYVSKGIAYGMYSDTRSKVILKIKTDNPDGEHGFIKWSDPYLKIRWPVHKPKSPNLSDNDRNAKSFKDVIGDGLEF